MTIPGPTAIAADDVCLFAHFDHDGRIDDHVVRYLESLQTTGFRIVFVTASRINSSDRQRLARICDDVILRENRGLDFGSWSEAYGRHRGSIKGRLLLTNDSVYGPIGNLGLTLQRLLAVPADVYGLVECNLTAPHLQSWFLLLENRVAQGDVFAALMSQPFAEMAKADVIKAGEIALSRRLLAAGYRLRALSTAGSGGPLSRLFPIHPMHPLWREMIEGEGVPFLKVELLRDNPTAVADLVDVPAVVSGHAPDLVAMIERHQARTRRAHVAIEGSTLRRRGYRIRAEYRLMRSGRVTESYLAAAAFLLLAVPYRLVRGQRPDGKPWRRQREADNNCNL
jgi:Rhamnan synthesis protein F